MANHRKAELAEHGHLVHRYVSQLQNSCRLGNASPRFPYHSLIADAGQENDALGRRVIGHHGEALSRPPLTRASGRPAAATWNQDQWTPAATDEGRPACDRLRPDRFWRM